MGGLQSFVERVLDRDGWKVTPHLVSGSFTLRVSRTPTHADLGDSQFYRNRKEERRDKEHVGVDRGLVDVAVETIILLN